MGGLDLVDHPFLVGGRKGVVVGRRELAGPRIKHLHHLGAGIDLVAHVGGDRIGQMGQQLVQQGGLLEGHRLDHGVVLGAFALHRVGGQGPGGADKAEHGGLVADIAAQAAEHFTHKRQGLGRIQGPQGIHLGLGADGGLDDRTATFDDVEVDAHARQGREDVGKEDHAIGLEGVEGLHRDLIGEIRVLGAFAEARVPVAQVPVDLHVTTGLAHHPDRRTLHLLTSGGAQQQGGGSRHGEKRGQGRTYPMAAPFSTLASQSS